MTYPTESIAGAAIPTYVASTFSASATSATFHNLSTWTELGTANPLGTSGDFVITVDYGKTSEEKIRCSSLDPNTGLITFVQRGYDDTVASVHSAGSAGTPNCFPVLSARDWEALQDRIETVAGVASEAQSSATSALSAASGAQSTADTALANAATAQSTANAKVASVTAGDSTVTIGGTATDPTIKVNTLSATGIYNVKSYGAVGNGSTDDTVAIQNAINAATSGGIVFFPPGTYIVSSTLNLLVDGTDIVGSGDGVNGGTIIKTSASFTSGDVFYLNNKTGRNLSGFSIRYTNAPSSGYAINQDAGGSDSIRNVRISYYNGVRSNGHILSLDNANITAINDCFVQSAGIVNIKNVVAGHTSGSTGAGFKLDAGTNTCRIVNSQTQNGGYGVVLTNSVAPGTLDPTFLWIYDLEINNPTNDGIYLQYGHEAYITNAWISGAGLSSGSNHGIHAASTFVGDVNVSNSQIQDMPGHGIFLEGGVGYQLSNSQIGGCSYITNNTYDSIHVSTGVTKVMLSAIQTDSTPYYPKTVRYGLFVESGAVVVQDSSCVFAGMTGGISNAGTINQTLQGLPVQYGTPTTGSFLRWNGTNWYGTRWLTPQNVISANQTLTQDLLYPVDTTSGNIALTLPGTSTNGGAVVGINLRTGANSIIINAASGTTINGSLSSIKLTSVGQSVLFTYHQAGATWNIIGASGMVAGTNGFTLPANVLTDSTSSTSVTTAATPNSVKTAKDAADSKVASVTAGDTSITVGGTATAPTVAVNQANLTIAESQVTGLVTDLSGKVPTTRTISTTSPLTGGGDLSADRTLAINDASTSAKGAVQLTDSTSSTSTTTAATPNSVKTSYDLANAALPKAGGTMSGDIDLNSVARVKNLVLPQAATDVARAGQLPPFTSISVNSTSSVPLKAWNGDPANITTFTSQTATMTSGIMAFTAVTLPYAATLTGVTIWQTTGAVPGTTGAVYQLGLYDTNGNLLASTPNNASNAFLALTGFFGWAFSSTYSATAGNYMIGMLWNSGTGGSPTVPIFGKPSNAGITQVNVNCPTPSSGKLDQRACTAGTGRSTLYNPMNVTPTASNSNFWAGLY